MEKAVSPNSVELRDSLSAIGVLSRKTGRSPPGIAPQGSAESDHGGFGSCVYGTRQRANAPAARKQQERRAKPLAAIEQTNVRERHKPVICRLRRVAVSGISAIIGDVAEWLKAAVC
jgi:hypothetical protein